MNTGLKALAVRFGRGVVRAAGDFLHDTRGGAMLVAGIFVISTMFIGGAGLLNLTWHEAHREEVRAALRAGIASVGATLLAEAGDGAENDEAIMARIGAFVEAATDTRVEVVTVAREGRRIDIGMTAEINVRDLLTVGDESLLSGRFSDSQAVLLTMTRNEFALALDVSGSMSRTFGSGTRLDALKSAMDVVSTRLEAAQRDSPAGMMVAVVPFAGTVRLADTGLAGITDDKKRYRRMMGDEDAKWVDVYHHYGVGATHEIPLPVGWNWDTEVWTGCFMARWGAYWDPLAGTPMTWPATKNGEPLHLSDAAPDRADPHTLFTPYSWPDTGPAGNIDARLQQAMLAALEGRGDFVSPPWVGDNDWSLVDGGGDVFCRQNVALPLTDDVPVVRQAVRDLRHQPGGPGVRGYTHTHTGIVWGLRMLSADWRDIWDVTDFRGDARPLPSGPGVHKVVLVVSDGWNVSDSTQGHFGPLQTVRGTLRNPVKAAGAGCSTTSRRRMERAGYFDVERMDDRTFNEQFDARWRDSLAASLGMPGILPHLATFEPSDAFRGTSAAFGDLLVAFGLPRPIHVGRHMCDYTSTFSPYGRLGDALYVGGEPVFGESPFPSREELPPRHPGQLTDARSQARARLYEWWNEACAIAADRDVTVHSVFIGDNVPSTANHIESLRQCSAATGGEALVTPDPASLEEAFRRLIRLRRELQFVD